MSKYLFGLCMPFSPNHASKDGLLMKRPSAEETDLRNRVSDKRLEIQLSISSKMLRHYRDDNGGDGDTIYATSTTHMVRVWGLGPRIWGLGLRVVEV